MGKLGLTERTGEKVLGGCLLTSWEPAAAPLIPGFSTRGFNHKREVWRNKKKEKSRAWVSLKADLAQQFLENTLQLAQLW